MSAGAPGQPSAPGGIVEIRPARPAGRLHPPEKWFLEHWCLTADTSKGTLTLTGDRYLSHKPHVFPLATADLANGILTVCLATYHWVIQDPSPRSGSTWRMLLLDREGRQAGAGMRRYNPQALRLFPPDVFEPLTTVGIHVVSEWHDSARALEDAHPGSVGRLALIGESRGKTAAIGLTAALVIVIITGITVYLFTH